MMFSVDGRLPAPTPVIYAILTPVSYCKRPLQEVRPTGESSRMFDLNDRKTKIMATIGPASDSPDHLQALLVAGMNVARLNFSYGSHNEHGRRIRRLRRLAETAGGQLAILQDLAGPKVRIGDFADGPIKLQAGGRFTLTTRPIVGDRDAVSVSYARLPQEVRPGDTLLLADGQIELEVRQVGGTTFGARSWSEER